MPAEATASVAGVLLAAGLSTRMGENKLLLEFDGQSTIRLAARRAAAAKLDPLIVVLGHQAARLQAEVNDLDCRLVINPEFACGMSGSLRYGIDHVPDEAGGAVVMLADMPFVTTAMIDALVARFRETGVPLVVSRYGAVSAPPTLFRRDLFGELVVTRGEGCGKEVVASHADEASVLDWPATALTDLDVPLDYERCVARLRAGR